MARSALPALALGLFCTPSAAEAATVAQHGALADPAAGLVLGPDGAFWHTSAGKTPRVGRTTALGVTREVALPGKAAPGEIISGPDLALWFTRADGSISRVTLAGAVDTVATLAAPATALAAGADGNVWAAVPGKGKKDTGAIARVTSAGQVTEFAGSLSGDPQDIAVGWDGALWFTEPAADRIGRITTAGQLTEYAVTSQPTALTAAYDGAVWFTAKHAVGRIALDGTATAVKTNTPQPGAIALGADGALWFARNNGVGRISTLGVVTGYSTPSQQPTALAAGVDGAMWFADAKHATLGRISLADAAAVVPPKLGKTVVTKVKHGKVKVKVRGSDRFVELTDSASLPVGSVVDARHGRVVVRSAVDAAGRTQSGTFYGGRFQVRQPRSAGGLVKIVLRGRLDCARGNVATISRRRHRKRRRRVWSSDSGGLFATLGLDSVTTVRGTKWLTEDRCSGTLTRVVRGTVVVRERRTGKRFVLHAGERHFARHRA